MGLLSDREMSEFQKIRFALQDIVKQLSRMNQMAINDNTETATRYQEIWNDGYLAGIKSMQPQVYPNDPPYRTSTYYEKLRRESEELKRKIQENLNNWDAKLEIDDSEFTEKE